jgi:hypothetical protein
MYKKGFQVKKSSGKHELFSEKKLYDSLRKSKASHEIASLIVQQLKPQFEQGINTSKIYSLAFRLLRKHAPISSIRYKLKQGIMQLGPSGFPFEKYIAKLFEKEGFKIETDIVLRGKCVTHEIDVVCTKENLLMVMECKYKNIPGVSVDVKVPLYIHSRFNDLLNNNLVKDKNTIFKGWIITNSRFTEDAQKFATCSGIHLLSWNYPLNQSLKDKIDDTGLYPLTCLNSITNIEKQKLLSKGIVLIQEISSNIHLLHELEISSKRIKTIQKECNSLTI